MNDHNQQRVYALIVHTGEKYLVECIQSVLVQNCSN